MVQKMQVQMPDGAQELVFIPDSVAYEAAMAAGEISAGMDIVYRGFIVHILPDFQMLVLTQLFPLGGNGFNV